MKKVLMTITLAFIIVILGVSIVPAQEKTNQEFYGIYLEPRIGVDAMIGEYISNRDESDSNVSIGGGLALGYDFWYQYNVPVRVEAEYMIRSTTHFQNTDRNVRAVVPQTIFANAYADFHNTTPVTPYVGGGVGVAFVGPENNFAWNVGGGASYDITDFLKASLGYRFVSYGNIEDKDTTGLLYGHEVLAGLRWTF